MAAGCFSQQIGSRSSVLPQFSHITSAARYNQSVLIGHNHECFQPLRHRKRPADAGRPSPSEEREMQSPQTHFLVFNRTKNDNPNYHRYRYRSRHLVILTLFGGGGGAWYRGPAHTVARPVLRLSQLSIMTLQPLSNIYLTSTSFFYFGPCPVC